MSVVVYSTPICTKCKTIKKMLKSKGIEFVELDVSTNEEALLSYQQSGYRSLPLVEVNGEFKGDGYEYITQL